MMKAVKGEGLPRLRAPFENGNLFINFMSEFPSEMDASVQSQLLKLLGPPKNVVTAKEDDEDTEVCELTAIDPVASFEEYVPPGNDEDDDEGGGEGGQRVQCAQQ